MMKRHPGTRRGSLTRRVPLALAACVLVLASSVPPAFGLRFANHPGCKDLCSGEFWAGAGADDVTEALARESAAVSYRGHVLRLAVSSSADADAVAVLLRAGAPPNAREETGHGRNMLQVAVLLGTDALSDRRRGADEPDRFSPEVVARRSAKLVAVLLAAGADSRAKNDSGLTAIDLARRYERDEALALLLAAVNAEPPCGTLCTEEFWKAADTKQVREALTQVTAVRGRTSSGDTPLHLAFRAAADVESVKLLLDRGADPNARSARDDTPLHVAAGTARGAAAIATLVARGAMVDAANLDEWPPCTLRPSAWRRSAPCVRCSMPAPTRTSEAARNAGWRAAGSSNASTRSATSARRTSRC